MILADLRTLLTRARGPAVERVPEHERAWGHVARAYLPHVIYGVNPITGARLLFWPSEVLTDAETRIRLDLTDPGTVHAVKVALALALGLDPGTMGCAVSWVTSGWPDHGNRWWHLTGVRDHRSLRSSEQCRRAGVMSDPRWDIDAPEVAAEPDPIKALVLACQHVIREKA